MTAIKLDARGVQVADDATDHASVLDEASGLQFAVNVPALNLLMTPSAAKSLVEAGIEHAGYSDWRITSPHELFALVEFVEGDLMADTNLFPDMQANWYLTNQNRPGDDRYVYGVYFVQGQVGFLDRKSLAYVRLVRNATASHDEVTA